jgi:hypothetical protein
VLAFLSSVAIVLTLVGYIPYIRAIQAGETKPHVFSWIIWGLTTFIVFFAQLEGGGGLGAWPIGVSGTMAIGVAYLAWRNRGDNSITASDRIFFGMALSSLPLWYFTSQPLWSVVTLTIADTLGFGPTLRKAHQYPSEENLSFWTLLAVRNAIACAALESLTVTTLLFPVVSGLTSVLVIVVVVWRRAALSATHTDL